MKLLYRGLHHTHYLPTLEVTEAEIAAHYRGVAYHSPVLRVSPQLQSCSELMYRGVPYVNGEHAGHVGVGQRAIAPRSQATTGRAVLSSSARSTRIAEVHDQYLRQNLERRLQAAQDQGNHQLVYLLEAERRQLA